MKLNLMKNLSMLYKNKAGGRQKSLNKMVCNIELYSILKEYKGKIEEKNKLRKGYKYILKSQKLLKYISHEILKDPLHSKSGGFVRINLKRSINRVDPQIKEFTKIKEALEEIYQLLVERVALTSYYHGQLKNQDYHTPLERKNYNFFSHTFHQFGFLENTMTHITLPKLNRSKSLTENMFKYKQLIHSVSNESMKILQKIRSDQTLQDNINKAIESILHKNMNVMNKSSVEMDSRVFSQVQTIEDKLTHLDDKESLQDLGSDSPNIDEDVIHIEEDSVMYELQKIRNEFLEDENLVPIFNKAQIQQSSSSRFHRSNSDISGSTINKLGSKMRKSKYKTHKCSTTIGFDSDNINIMGSNDEKKFEERIQSPQMNHHKTFKKKENGTSIGELDVNVINDKRVDNKSKVNQNITSLNKKNTERIQQQLEEEYLKGGGHIEHTTSLNNLDNVDQAPVQIYKEFTNENESSSFDLHDDEKLNKRFSVTPKPTSKKKRSTSFSKRGISNEKDFDQKFPGVEPFSFKTNPSKYPSNINLIKKQFKDLLEKSKSNNVDLHEIMVALGNGVYRVVKKHPKAKSLEKKSEQYGRKYSLTKEEEIIPGPHNLVIAEAHEMDEHSYGSQSTYSSGKSNLESVDQMSEDLQDLSKMKEEDVMKLSEFQKALLNISNKTDEQKLLDGLTLSEQLTLVKAQEEEFKHTRESQSPENIQLPEFERKQSNISQDTASTGLMSSLPLTQSVSKLQNINEIELFKLQQKNNDVLTEAPSENPKHQFGVDEDGQPIRYLNAPALEPFDGESRDRNYSQLSNILIQKISSGLEKEKQLSLAEKKSRVLSKINLARKFSLMSSSGQQRDGTRSHNSPSTINGRSSNGHSIPRPETCGTTVTEPFSFTHSQDQFSYIEDYERMTMSDPERYISLESKNKKQSLLSMEDFDYVKTLGKGAYGKVYLVRKVTSGDFYAMKVIGTSKPLDDKEIQNILNERNIFDMVQSEFCVNALGTFVYRNLVCFVIEIMQGGDLYQFAFEGQIKLDSTTISTYIAQIVLGIEHLHNAGIMHRDIKPANILVDKDGNLKLTDYGLSELKHDLCKQGSKFSKTGSLNYMAPEIFKEETKELTFGVDWYALGVLIFDIIKERLPFYGDTPDEVLDQILDPHIVWDYPSELEDSAYCFSPELKDLVLKLLEPDPEKRIKSAEEIKSHPYFNQERPKNWQWVQEKKYYVYKPDLVCDLEKYTHKHLKFKNMKDFIDEEFKELLFSMEMVENMKRRKGRINEIASKVEMLKHETLHHKNRQISKKIK